jgi:hypothetical protein
MVVATWLGVAPAFTHRQFRVIVFSVFAAVSPAVGGLLALAVLERPVLTPPSHV